MFSFLPFVGAAGLLVIGVVMLITHRMTSLAVVCVLVALGLAVGGMNHRLGGSVHPCRAIATHWRSWVDPGLSIWECQWMVIDRSFGLSAGSRR